MFDLLIQVRKNKPVLGLLFMLCIARISAQTTGVSGSVIDGLTALPIPEVIIYIEGSNLNTSTDAQGNFSFTGTLPLGEQVLKLEKTGYQTKRYPIIINDGQQLEILGMTLDYDQSDKNDLFIISISDDNLNSDDDILTENISGLLQSSRDIFLRAAAFDFSATFFRPRGLDNSYGKLLINGVEMNKLFNGRPQWANWGGLNDVQRNQHFSMGLAPNNYAFGGLSGTNNLIMRASNYQQGGRISYAAANRSYQGRIMASYSSGQGKGGWSYSLLFSRRFGNQGFIEGTLYDSNSFFTAVEHQFNYNHSLNLTAIYAQNRRGRSTAITDEVYRLKDRNYNPYWGYQEGKLRNSRIRKIVEPLIMLNHYWNLSPKTKLNTNLAYQWGEISNSRVDNGGTRLVTIDGEDAFLGGALSPDPTYYQNLPSYYLRNNNPSTYDYTLAFLASEEFKQDGQWDWQRLYEANANLRERGANALYALQADVVKDSQWSVNSILEMELNPNLRLNATLDFRVLKSENFARIEDLLGATGFLDIDFFADEPSNLVNEVIASNRAQSDLRNPNRIALKNDRYKYNYEVKTQIGRAFVQTQFSHSKIDAYASVLLSSSGFQREGLFENGFFPGEGPEGSFGKSTSKSFLDFSVKAGATYRFTGRHMLNANATYQTITPGIRTLFANARQNNSLTTGIESEHVFFGDLSYLYRSATVNGRLTGFLGEFKNGSDIGYYFTEDLSGLGVNTGDVFVQEHLTNISRQHIGLEIGIETQITPTFIMRAAGSIGQYIYSNNPDFYLTSADFEGELRFGDGTTKLKNYHVAGGPERAAQIGFEYRDPAFWNIGISANYFSHAFSDISNLARTANFTSDFDGNTFSDYDPSLARDLLRQEQFKDYTILNIIGGKSWRVKSYYVGFFATINNVLNQDYRTGGFEQSRLANYRRLQEDRSRPGGPLFGSRYFFGNGTTYYINMYIKF